MTDRPADFTYEERRLAKAIYRALRLADSSAFLDGDEDDLETWEAVAVDGRFSLPLVARYVREALREAEGETHQT